MSPRLELPKARAYRDFRISDLFVASNGDTDIQATHINGFGIPVVSSGTKNNGIIGLTDIKAKVFEPGTITIDMFGNCYYQNARYKMVTHARVFSLSPFDFALNEKLGLYLVTQFSFLTKLFSYGNMASWQKIKDFYVSLPILENGEIDFLYIENYMQAIKDYRLKELDDYLNAAGFEDCTLTREEEQSIKCNKDFASNIIGNLFDIKKGKRLTKANMIAGDINFIGATSNNNGITAHISNTSHLHRGNLITVTYNGSVGESFYQPSKFWASDDVNVMYSKFNMTECLGLYFVTLFRKQGRKYGYSYKWTKELMEKDSVFLPIDIDESVDYRYMETYIRAIMKQTIAKLKAAMTIESQEVTIEKDEPAILDFVEVQDRFNTYLPVYPLRAACGYFDDCGKLQDDDAEGWIDASGLGRTLNDKMFVVHAEGDSMEPKIHDGDFCVFDASGAGSREGKIVLCKARDKSDRNASSFTIKKYHSEKIATEEGWMHSQITLSPLNVNYNPIIISVEEAEEDEFKIYGEFICII